MARLKPKSHDFDETFNYFQEGGFSRFTGTFSGGDWYGDYLRIWGEKNSKTIFRDTDAAEGRLINHLELGWNSDVDLISTSVHTISGGAGKLHDVTLGSGYLAYMGLTAAKNIVTTGSGHSEYIFLSGAQNDVTTGDGGVAYLRTEGSSNIDIGAGGAGTIRTGNGDDRLVIRGSVNSIKTGAGDDVVVTSGQWIDEVNLGAGDDTVVVKALDAWYELRVVASSNVKNGVDTLDFSKLKMGVKFELGNGGAWQEVYKSKKIDAWVSETGIENVIGTRKNDVLTANPLDNEFTGGKGKDVFVFGKDGGTDTVTDFEIGTDILRLKGHKGGFATLEIKDGDIVLDGGTVDLVGIDAGDLSADSFSFV